MFYYILILWIGLYKVAKEHCNIAKEQLKSQKDLAKERLSKKE